MPPSGAGLGPCGQFPGDLEWVSPAVFEQHGHSKHDWIRGEFDYTPEAIPVQETGYCKQPDQGDTALQNLTAKPGLPPSQTSSWSCEPQHIFALPLSSIRERILRTLENANCFSEKKKGKHKALNNDTNICSFFQRMLSTHNYLSQWESAGATILWKAGQ